MTKALNDISLVDSDLQLCPFDHDDRIREETPVFTYPKTGFGLLTRYADVRMATADSKSYSSKAGQIAVRDGSPVADEVRQIYEAGGWPPVHSLVNNDPPDHGRFRSFVDKAFLPKHVKVIEPQIRAIAEKLCDGLPLLKATEIASTALFLASPLASGITGAGIAVDCGMTAG